MTDDGRIEDGQRVALLRLLGLSGGFGEEGRFLLARLLGRVAVETDELTVGDWRSIRDRAYPAWRNDCWDVGDAFKAQLGGYKREYLEVVLGQGSLFGPGDAA